MHHGDDVAAVNFKAFTDEAEHMRQRFDAVKNAARLGATGQFPGGKLNTNDQGEIRFGVGHDPSALKVLLNFGKSVAWIGMSPEQAIDLGTCLIKHARDCRTIGGKESTGALDEGGLNIPEGNV